MELSLGFNAGKRELIRDLPSIYFFGGRSLLVLAYYGFVPAEWDDFPVISWVTGLVSSLGTIDYESHVASRDARFVAAIENTIGPKGLRLQTITIHKSSVTLAGVLVYALPFLARPWRE